MRTNYRQTRNVVNIAKAVLLIICMLTVFSMVICTLDIDSNIAYGGTYTTVELDGDAHVGMASPIFGDKGELKASDLNFIQNGSTAERTFTVKDSFDTVSASVTNHSATKNSGDTILYTWVGGISESDTSTGHWKYGVANANVANRSAMIINYNIGSFLSSLLQRPDVTIQARFSANYEVNEDTAGWTYSGVTVLNSMALTATPPLTAEGKEDRAYYANQALSGMTDGNTFGKKAGNVRLTSKTGTDAQSGYITLTPDTPIFGMAIGFDWGLGKWGSRDVHIHVWNLKIEIKVTLKDSSGLDGLDKNENADTLIVDNSAPVVTSQYSQDGIATQAPYISSNAQTGWAVWDSSFSSQLSRYIDNVTFGSGTMPSFTNTALGNIGGQDYYKTTSTQYTDTYDYSGSGGFSAQTLMNLYNDGGTAAVQAALPYMGFGLNTLDYANIDFAKLIKGDYAGALTWTGGADKRFVSGIKTVQVGDARVNMDDSSSQAAAVFNVYEIAVGATVGKSIYIDGEVVGYAEVKRDNRAQVTVNTYMYTNARIRTTVSDFGSASTFTDITFKGIDTQCPTIGENGSATNSGINMDISAYLNGTMDADLLSWYRTNKLSNGTGVEIYEDEDSEGFSPYVWYYTVQKANSFDYLPSPYEYNSYAEIKAAGLTPIGFGELTSFDFDFSTGLAKGIGSSEYNANGIPSGEMSISGNGYYRFTFYTVDLAGNIANVSQSFYAKADTTTPQYNVSLSYLDADGISQSITSAQNGTKWATGKTTLTISIVRNFSGNSIIFEDANNTYMLTIDGEGDRRSDGRGYGYGNLVTYGTTSSMNVASSNNILLELQSNLQPATADVSVKLNGNYVDVTFVFDNAEQTIAFISEFTVYAGQYDSIDAPNSDEMANSYVNSSWVDGVHVLVDRTAPNMPLLNDTGENDNLVDFNYSAPSVRNWYTDGYRYELLVAFNDILVNSDYAEGIKIFAGMKYVANMSDVATLQALSIEDIYDTINDSNFGTYFDKLQILNGNQLDGDETSIILDLIKDKKAGMRVIFVWVQDQAGNISQLNKYSILADDTSYVVNSGILNNAVLGATATIAQTNVDEIYSTTFKRGESVYFNLDVNEGYVPFKFTKTCGLGSVTLLENYTPTASWTLANNAYASYVMSDGDYSFVEYVHDDPSSFAPLDSITTITFAHRLVVTRNITSVQVQYTSLPVVIPMTLNFDGARESFEYNYYDLDGNPIARPTNVGDYKVEMFIAKDNPNFVTNDFVMDGDGNPVHSRIDFGIIRGNAVITANATQSVYGDAVVLTYTLSGIVEENLAAEGINFTLELKVDGYDPALVYDAGQYQIVATGLKSNYANYNVSYVSAYHNITQKSINIYAWAASKSYGSADPMFLFGLKKGEVSSAMLLDAFDGLGYVNAGEGVFGLDEYYLLEAGNRITRASGENVGEYSYNIDTSLFEVNRNYKVVAQATQRFVINQRVVTLEVGGQSSLYAYGDVIDVASIRPTYTLSMTDAHLASEIASLVGNSLTISETSSPVVDDNYSQVLVHTILLGATGNANISLQLGTETDYVIYVALQNALIISIKDGVTFEFTYGDSLESIINSLVFGQDKFDISGSVPEYDSISWTATIDGASATPNAGRYIVTVTGAGLVKDGVATSDSVIVEAFAINVNPATINILPSRTASSKLYGESDSVYGISYTIVDIEGVSEGVYAGIDFADIISTISGSFVRARYTSAGVFRSFGTMYDDATLDCKIISKLLGEGEYYSWAIGSAFASSNTNFKVNATFDSEDRFEIERRELVINTSQLVGINKSYDNSTSVHYGTQKAYDFASSLARATDEVYLTFDASYLNRGSAIENTKTSILFEHLQIAGSSAHNYVLTSINNDGVDVAVDGADSGITNVTTIIINAIDNSRQATGSNAITIFFGQIGVHKTDVTISKEYDNTLALTMAGVSIANVSDSNGIGTAILAQIAQRGDAIVLEGESDTYSGTLVSSNYTINTISLFFPLANAEEVVIVNGIDNDVVVSVTEIDGVKGIKVVLKNMQASITARVIDADSFESIVAVDRDYNSTGIVDIDYTFSVGALAEGDTVESVGLDLKGLIEGGVYNVGNYNVDVRELSSTLNNTNSYLANSNYVLDNVSINNAFDLSVIINRAKLMPNITFTDKEYDNTTDVATVAGVGTNALTTLHYADNLKHELDTMSISGTIVYALSQNGVLDANVQADLWHNVMVSGLTIIADAQVLANYEIYGSRYIGGSYISVGSITSNALIQDYEMLDVVRVTKKYLPIISNNVIVEDKIYDGTNIANVTIKIAPEHVPAGHADLLEIVASGTFARRQVGNNIVVNIDTPVLTAKTEEGRALLHNYELQSFSGRFLGNIIPQPVVITANLGEKVYNGETDIFKGNIQYTLEGLSDADRGYYAVQTLGGAYYDDEDVNVERNALGEVVWYADQECTSVLTYDGSKWIDADGVEAINKFAKVISKTGVIYNPTLANKQENYINYVLSVASSYIDDSYIAYKLDGESEPRYYQLTAQREGVTFYYPLKSTTKYVESVTESNRAYIVGTYKVDGNLVYIVSSDCTDSSVKTLDKALTYLLAEGKITQRKVYIKDDGIRAITGTQAFTKQYDGTTKFFGVKDVDYEYVDGSIANVIAGDVVDIAHVSAEFDSASTNALNVLFSASGIAGADAYKYQIDTTSPKTMSIYAKITKHAIDAYLADGSIVYGTSASDIKGEFAYKLGGFDLVWNETYGSFFMRYDDYLYAMGFVANHGDAPSEDDAKYIATINNETYNLNNATGLFEKTATGVVGEYVRLKGTFTLPGVDAQFASARPGAGSTAESYTMDGGYALNFAFVAHYTNAENTSSTLTVLKRDLYVSTDGGALTKIYGDRDPKVSLVYNNRSPYDIGQRIFIIGGVDYNPIAKLAIYNSTTGITTICDKYAKITSDLASDEHYVYVLVAPNGVDYSTIIANYNVHLGTITHIVDEGQIVPVASYPNAVTYDVSTLTISLPTLDGVSVKSVDNTFVYTEVEGVAVNRVGDVLQGLLAGDSIFYLDGLNVLSATNAGVYSGVIKVVRSVKIDESDPNGYTIEWVSGEVVNIAIERASINAIANNANTVYSGEVQRYDTSGSSQYFSFSYLTLSESDFVVTYQKRVNGEWVDAELLDAGVYKVIIKTRDGFETDYKNYLAVNVEATYTISKAAVNITLLTDGYTLTQDGTIKRLKAVYQENGVYTIDFNIAMASSVPAGARLDYSDFELVFSNGTSEVNLPGEYSFQVRISNQDVNVDNYNLVGGSGFLELLATQLSSSDNSILVEDGFLANKFIVREIVSNNSSLVSDETYFEAIKAYMPVITRQEKLKTEAELLAVLLMSLQCGGNDVSLGGRTMRVSLSIPDGITSLDNVALYTVTQEGGLEKLTNYQVVNGKIEYTTDYLGALVFVDVSQPLLEPWAMYLVIGISTFVGLFILYVLVATAVRKSKIKKLQ